MAATVVEFRACGLALARNRIKPKEVLPEGSAVPSGRGEVAWLRIKEGIAYLRP